MIKPRTPAPRKKTTGKGAGRVKPAPVTAAPPPQADTARQTALELARLALDKKALDVVVLDVRGLTSYAEYFVLATAESEPQLNAIADHMETRMRERGERPIGVEGTNAGHWVLIDFADVVVHVFSQDTREFYDLEGLWADAKRVAVEG